MSLFLLYFDGGPLETMSGHRGRGMELLRAPLKVSSRGALLAPEVLVINVDGSGAQIRADFDPFLHRELFRFIAMRQAAGWTPHLLFHWEDAPEDIIDAASNEDVSVADPLHLFACLHEVPEDALVRVIVTNLPSLSAAEILDERLAEGDFPWFDGVVHADGTIDLLRCRRDPDPQVLPSVRPLVRCSLSSFWERNINQWASTTLLSPTSWEAEGAQVICGQGGVGFEDTGVVVVRDLHDGKLRWAAHFDDSGTFTGPQVHHGELVVTAAQTGLKWCFPLARPERVRVERPPS